MLFEKALEKIENNRKIKESGGYVGVPFPFAKFKEFYPSFDKGHSVGILAGTGVGKSSLLRFMFVYYLYEFYMKTGYKMKIFYFPLEDNKEKVYDYFICNYLYKVHGIRISIQELNSKSDRALPDFVLEKIKEGYKYFSEFEKIITVIDGYTEPEPIYKLLEKYAINTGKISTYTVDVAGVKEHQKIYDSNVHTFVLIDNMANIDKGEDHASERAAIVEMSKIYIRERLCNFFKFTVIQLLQNDFQTERQQFSTNGKSIMGKVEPSLASIGEAKTISRSMHIIFTLFDPSRYDFIRYPQVNDQNAHRAYDIDLLGNKFRSFRIIKNNEGDVGMRLGLMMNPFTGEFEELPSPDSDDMKHIYNKLKSAKVPITSSKNTMVFKENYISDEESPF